MKSDLDNLSEKFHNKDDVVDDIIIVRPGMNK